MNLKPSLDWLLVFVPVTALLHYLAPDSHTWVFLCACVAIIPLAGWMGRSTEHLAERTSEGIGGLLNATFGNAAELIIALVALRRGMTEIVKASLTGSIIGNILLVLGASFLAGGLRFKEQRFQAGAARMQATLLTLAAVGLVAPAAFHFVAGAEALTHETELSVSISVVLLLVYALGLLFTLRTHSHMFRGHGAVAAHAGHGEGNEPWPIKRSLSLLVGATVLVAWISEMLVASVEVAAHDLGMSEIFVGIIVVAVIGNAAEHSTAVLMALKNRMDLSLTIAIGSSIQIALFVAPLLCLLSLLIAPAPMNLLFSPAEIVAVVLAITITGQIAEDGESNWMEGALLLAVYLIIGLVFFYL